MGRPVLWVLVLAGCGRFGFSLDVDATGDGVGDGVVPPPSSCSQVSGRACTAAEICEVATVATPDVGMCCPASRCLAIGNKRVVTATATATPLTIDGVLTEWAAIPTLPILNKTIGNPSATDFTAKYSVQWDASKLYVLFQMTDDVCRAQDSVPPRSTAYNDDTVEVYLDIDPTNNTTSTYRPDEAWTWIPQSCGASMAICGLAPPAAPLTTKLMSWVRPPPNNNSVPGTTVIATYKNDGPTSCNWWVEIAVDWPSGFATPIAGDVIGFDAAANDDDTGMRKNQLFWNDATGTLSMDARKFGLLKLLP